ncbi:MAG: GTP-binding protein gtr2 [Thelocarpon impressellum]|nr:MAG: GTP-binding protein gtr2 [Thelocarpon impressellum]
MDGSGGGTAGVTGRLANGKVRDGKPRLLLMGQRRSGKTSISSVVFHKMPPPETLFLESTSRIQRDSMHSFMDFQVWDFPGQLDFLDPQFDVENIFGEIGALIWVIDAQDEYLDAINRLNTTILNLQQSYPLINIEVFIHKVDGLSEDYKFDIQRDIVQRIQDELSDAGFENAPVNFHLTSIYDHSIFEAFSKVIQKLIPQLPTLENLLNLLCTNCHMEKTFLFDVLSKIYIATDASPVDMPSYEVCSDYIDVIVDVSEIYGWDRPQEVLDDVWREEALPDAESTILLYNNRYIYLREINKYLALICLMKDDCAARKGMIDINVNIFQDAVAKVFGFEK